jgi:hypothetical protein
MNQVKMTIDEMVRQLTKKEFEFLIDHPGLIDDLVSFFLEGGYKQFSDSRIQYMYNRDIKED